MLALMAAAAVADVVTMLALPPGGELNPVAAMLLAVSPLLVIGGKAGLTLALIRAPLADYRNRIYGFATVAWSFGAITNVLSWR